MILALMLYALAETGGDSGNESSPPEDTSVFYDSDAAAELVYTQDTGCGGDKALLFIGGLLLLSQAVLLRPKAS
jgi:hypothetical protein